MYIWIYWYQQLSVNDNIISLCCTKVSYVILNYMGMGGGGGGGGGVYAPHSISVTRASQEKRLSPLRTALDTLLKLRHMSVYMSEISDNSTICWHLAHFNKKGSNPRFTTRLRGILTGYKWILFEKGLHRSKSSYVTRSSWVKQHWQSWPEKVC